MYDQRVALIIGTRPEAIKLSPLARTLADRGIFPRIVLTGQHQNLDPDAFGFSRFPVTELGCVGQTNPHMHVGHVARRIRSVLEGVRLVVVQGDTSSALGGALGAARAGVPVAHVEAGLRSHDRENPWPEEDFRVAIDDLAELLFAPTEMNAGNLRRERVRGQIVVTGNTGIDALLERIPQLPEPRSLDGLHRILVTCHRRESWGAGLEAIAGCLLQIACQNRVQMMFALHPNPTVAGDMRRLLDGHTNITLIAPCTHPEMLLLMRESDLILSDSGGVQEEAPALGIPLLILRDRTERPEGIAAGNAILVGRNPETILTAVERLLADPCTLAAMSKPAFPYGDGRASSRIAIAIEEWLASGWYKRFTDDAERVAAREIVSAARSAPLSRIT